MVLSVPATKGLCASFGIIVIILSALTAAVWLPFQPFGANVLVSSESLPVNMSQRLLAQTKVLSPDIRALVYFIESPAGYVPPLPVPINSSVPTGMRPMMMMMMMGQRPRPRQQRPPQGGGPPPDLQCNASLPDCYTVAMVLHQLSWNLQNGVEVHNCLRDPRNFSSTMSEPRQLPREAGCSKLILCPDCPEARGVGDLNVMGTVSWNLRRVFRVEELNFLVVRNSLTSALYSVSRMSTTLPLLSFDSEELSERWDPSGPARSRDAAISFFFFCTWAVLLVTTVTILMDKQRRQHQSPVIFLLVALLAASVCWWVDGREVGLLNSQGPCQAIAFFLNFSRMSAVCYYAALMVNIFSMIYVSPGGSKYHRFAYSNGTRSKLLYLLVPFCVALLLSLLPFSVINVYGTSFPWNFCWYTGGPSTNRTANIPISLFFFLPSMMVFVFNIIMTSLVIRYMMKTAKKSSSPENKRKAGGTGAFAVVAISVIAATTLGQVYSIAYYVAYLNRQQIPDSTVFLIVALFGFFEAGCFFVTFFLRNNASWETWRHVLSLRDCLRKRRADASEGGAGIPMEGIRTVSSTTDFDDDQQSSSLNDQFDTLSTTL